MTPEFLNPRLLSAARALFPFLSTGRIYLNHAATSPLSTRVVAAMERHLEERSTGTVDTYRTDLSMFDRLRNTIAGMINAESAARIAFTMNTSDAISIIASGIPWKAGDRLILNNAEFPANVYPYRNIRNEGAIIDMLPATNGVVTPDQLEQCITPKTRVVALSAVQFLSGYKADLHTIGSICRDRGILFVIDGIQAVGATEIDVQGMKIDALGAGAQKWQMSPHGTGFLYVSEELQGRLQQQFVGWLGAREPWDFFNYDQPLHATAKRFEGGTVNVPGLWGMDAAVGTLAEFGIGSISNHLLALTDRLMARLEECGLFDLMTPREHRYRAGILTVTASGGIDAAAVFKGLEAASITISLREGALRISPHFYNSADEIDATADILIDLARKNR